MIKVVLCFDFSPIDSLSMLSFTHLVCLQVMLCNAGMVYPAKMPSCFDDKDVAIYLPGGVSVMSDMDLYHSLFYACHVVGSLDRTCVVQWTTNDDRIYLAVLRLNPDGTYRTLAVFSPDSTSDVVLYEATISPAQNQFLLRPSQVLCNRFMRSKYTTLPENHVKVIDIELGVVRTKGAQTPSPSDEYNFGQTWRFREADNCYEETEPEVYSFGKCLHLTDLFEDVANQVAYAYDPRFPNNRIAWVNNLNIRSNRDNDHRLVKFLSTNLTCQTRNNHCNHESTAKYEDSATRALSIARACSTVTHCRSTM